MPKGSPMTVQDALANRDQSRGSLTILDNRTGQQYEIPIEHGAIQAKDLSQIKTSAEDPGLVSYDPGFLNTAACKSTITYIDGDAGILEYRGYPIEQLAARSTYLDVAYLLLEGDLPSRAQQEVWEREIHARLLPPRRLWELMASFHYDAHPMGMMAAACVALGTFFPEAKHITDPAIRHRQIIRMIGMFPTLAAMIYRHTHDLHPVLPDPSLPYTANFLQMMFRTGEAPYTPDPVLVRALDVLLILHADHEQNCSTSAVRSVASSTVEPYSAIAAGIEALYGPAHGGANEAVLRQLDEIGSADNVPAYIESVKAGERRLMGFGHRVYKNFDPRAQIIKELAHEVFRVTREDPLLKVALELERIALSDNYFISRKLYPNVDFYSGLIYRAMGFPVEFFTVLFAVGRVSGWLAQWEELMRDKEQKIARPKQLYLGHRGRSL